MVGGGEVRKMLYGGDRVRCAVCADGSFSPEKNVSWSRSGGRRNLTVCVEPSWVEPKTVLG